MTKPISNIKEYIHYKDLESGELDSGALRCEEFYDKKGNVYYLKVFGRDAIQLSNYCDEPSEIYFNYDGESGWWCIPREREHPLLVYVNALLS